MPYTIAGKNAMLDALTALATYCGLLTATAITGVTGTATTNLLNKTSHGLSDGDLVILSLLASEGAGLFNDVPYFVVGVAGSDFSLAETSGGAAIDFTTDIVGCTVTKYAEISGGSPAYARKAVAYAAAAVGLADDSTNGAVFDVPAAAVVDAVGTYSASTAGTLYGIDPVTQETFGGQGTYTLTDQKLDLNGDRVAA
jgi:hypothetical protein